ncbi:MAG: PDZ domain-containing protein [Bacteroidota bacterium]
MRRLLHFGLLLGFLLSGTFTHGQDFVFSKERKYRYTVPFELQDNLIIISLRVNNSSSLRFIVDSGVQSAILMNIKLGQELNLNFARKVKLRGLGRGEKLEAYQSTKNQVRVGELQGKNQMLFVLTKDIFHLSGKLGTDVQGLIGYPLFENFIVKLNYREGAMTFYDPEHYTSKIRNRSVRLPLEIEDTKAYVRAKVLQNEQDTIEVKLLVDCGASNAMWLNANSSEQLELPEKRKAMFLGRGLNGDIQGHLGRVDGLLLGKYLLPKPIVAFPDSASAQEIFGVGERNGALGGEILRRFTVIFDYPNKQLILTPNRSFSDPFEYNMTGLEIVKPMAFLPYFEVSVVDADSPAARAGVQVGDQLVEVNNIRAKDLTMNKLSELFQSQAGRTLRITVARNGKYLKKKLVLKREI